MSTYDPRVARAIEYTENQRLQDAVNAEWDRVLRAHPDVDQDAFRTFAEQALEAGELDFESAYGRYSAQVQAEQHWEPSYEPEDYPPEPAPRPTMDSAADELMAELKARRAR